MASLLMPWFPPLALGVGVAATRMALDLPVGERPRRVDRFLWLALGWYPLLMWLVAQVVSSAVGRP